MVQFGFVELGGLPERFHFVDGGLLGRFAMGGEAFFDVSEAAAEFGIGFAEGLFGIDFQEAGDVDDYEKQVADFVFDFSGVAGGAGGFDLGEFFIQLVENLVDVFPIETGSGGFRGDFLGFD